MNRLAAGTGRPGTPFFFFGRSAQGLCGAVAAVGGRARGGGLKCGRSGSVGAAVQ